MKPFPTLDGTVAIWKTFDMMVLSNDPGRDSDLRY